MAFLKTSYTSLVYVSVSIKEDNMAYSKGLLVIFILIMMHQSSSEDDVPVQRTCTDTVQKAMENAFDNVTSEVN